MPYAHIQHLRPADTSIGALEDPWAGSKNDRWRAGYEHELIHYPIRQHLCPADAAIGALDDSSSRNITSVKRKMVDGINCQCPYGESPDRDKLIPISAKV